jgi:hypothetical protein
MTNAIGREPFPLTVTLPTLPAPLPAPSAHVQHGSQSSAAPSAFAALLQGLAREVSGGESLTRSALGAASAGRAIGPAELIALQAGIYRYGEAVDLASRLIDRATGAVKTVVQAT